VSVWGDGGENRKEWNWMNDLHAEKGKGREGINWKLSGKV
jgi:hypothetical protein